jgi:hypothetical protein
MVGLYQEVFDTKSALRWPMQVRYAVVRDSPPAQAALGFVSHAQIAEDIYGR